MAHGLRSIVNGGYMPYGSGRDWFFLGDFQYQNGRRTPDCNTRWKEDKKGKVEPKRRPRGQPTEMAMTKSISGQLGASSLSSSSASKSRGMSPRACERLRRQQSEPTCNDMLMSSGGKDHTARWKDANCSSRPLKAGGCLRRHPRDLEAPPPGPATSSYMDLGQVHRLGHSYTFSEWGAPEKHRFHSAHCQPPPKEEVDEHMKEFPGKQSKPSHQQSIYYQNALQETETPLEKPLSKGTKGLLEWGHPHKHHNHSGKCYPPKDVDLEQHPERPPGWRPPEYGMPDKHRYHQPPLWAPKCPLGQSRIPPGKASEIPAMHPRATATMKSADIGCF